MDPQQIDRRNTINDDDEDDDDIHTITSLGFCPQSNNNTNINSHNNDSSGGENFRVIHNNNDPTTLRQQHVISSSSSSSSPLPPILQQQRHQSQRGSSIDAHRYTTTQSSSPDLVYSSSNPDIVALGNVHIATEVDDSCDGQTTNTMEYAMSLNSMYSHRDALSASGSYGADMSFVTTQSDSIVAASPDPKSFSSLSVQQQQQQRLPLTEQEQALPRLHLHQLSDEQAPPLQHHDSMVTTMTTTHSAIKAAMERGANRAYDESSSVFGYSTVAHTIASSSNLTKDSRNKYFFNSTFLRSHNYNSVEADTNVVEDDNRPSDVPLSPSLPFKSTDLTTDSMFLGMEYDTDYIKTTLKGNDTHSTSQNPTDTAPSSSDETIRRLHRKRIVCCVYSLIALIVLVGIGGILCTFGTTCPGLENLSTRSSTGSSSSATVEDQMDDGTLEPTPAPWIRKIPTATNVPTKQTGRPVVIRTNPPTTAPVVLEVPPPMATVKVSETPNLSPTKSLSPSSPTKSPTNESDTKNEEDAVAPSPSKDDNNDGDGGESPTGNSTPEDNSENEDASDNENEDSPDNDNEDVPDTKNEIEPPTAAPIDEARNDVNENGTKVPISVIPTNEPTILPRNDIVPTISDNNDDNRNPITDDDSRNPTTDDFNDTMPTSSPTFIKIRQNDDDNASRNNDDDNNPTGRNSSDDDNNNNNNNRNTEDDDGGNNNRRNNNDDGRGNGSRNNP